uniref:membrane progestin receptor gamma-like n=1 Tax=Styela clava TaxID=7725 RepID=UPI00193A1C6F|nr:membrane progestin receptor gamma-like [Styela clava]
MENNKILENMECHKKCCCAEENVSKTHSVVGRFFTFCALHLFGFDRHNTTSCMKRKQKKEVSRDAWLQSFGLLRSKDVPSNLQEVHLIVGYRPNPSSFSYCLKSIFYPTNEMMNFWTHFVAFVILVYRFYTIFAYKLQGPLNDPLYYPVWVYCFGFSGMPFGSCLAHLFNCYSRNVREACWFCDYVSITLSTFASAIVYHHFICPYTCIGVSYDYYIEALGVVSILGHAACCYSRRMTSGIRYLFRSLVFVFLYVASTLPCAYLYIFRAAESLTLMSTYDVHDDKRCVLDSTNFIPLLSLVTIFCFLTMYFNVSKVPEKYFPGTFDIIGHSHNWMHICIGLAFYFQTYLLEGPLLEADARRATNTLTPEDLHITWWNTIGIMTTTAVCCFATSSIMTYNLPCSSKKETTVNGNCR